MSPLFAEVLTPFRYSPREFACTYLTKRRPISFASRRDSVGRSWCSRCFQCSRYRQVKASFFRPTETKCLQSQLTLNCLRRYNLRRRKAYHVETTHFLVWLGRPFGDVKCGPRSVARQRVLLVLLRVMVALLVMIVIGAIETWLPRSGRIPRRIRRAFEVLLMLMLFSRLWWMLRLKFESTHFKYPVWSQVLWLLKLCHGFALELMQNTCTVKSSLNWRARKTFANILSD